MAETEARHWWFTARRDILAAILERLRLPCNARILEIGCGTGGNLDMLSRFGRVSALESDAQARAMAMQKTRGRFDIRPGRCPDQMPFGQRFDLVCMFDVLEHIDEDQATLVALGRLLVPGGRALLTVPAYAWLWSSHDEFLHHKRRYTMAELRRKIATAGLRIARLTYFNTVLFPLVAMARLRDRLLRRERALGTVLPAAPLNALLHSVFSAERYIVGRAALPFGVSLLALAEAA